MGKPQSILKLNVGDPVFAEFRAWALASYPGLPLAFAAREAILAATRDPLNAAVAAARDAGFTSASTTARRVFARAFAEAAAECRAESQALFGM
jgi:hypothetical protein